MSFTLDPEVPEALAPIAAAMAGSTPPPVGDVAARRAAGLALAWPCARLPLMVSSGSCWSTLPGGPGRGLGS